MDTSIDYELVSMDAKTQNLEKVSSIEASNNSAMDTSELESYIDGYKETVKKYLQVGHHYRIHGNTHHGTPVTSNQH
ncbi:41767_t:CDS:2 [Gigaspora margarita]|uniref:41767_t:CDS:1 n=1 Tax=Gigaspora margarita TaxID=4874 RepID=A0ABN7VBR8_GIGMA|nr:41767_t:CDS:2 [Gigaspora margarita]